MGRHSTLGIVLTIFIIVVVEFAHAQNYTLGVPVCDTVDVRGYGGCPDDETFSIQLDSTISPYVSGLRFQVGIIKIDGILLSENLDTLAVGDTLSILAANETGLLKIKLRANSGFNFVTKVIGIPSILVIPT